MQNTGECLLIDDDLDDQEIFQMCLTAVNPGINFLAMDNPVAAVSRLTTDSLYKPAYIFIDMNMPRINGIECLKKIKSLEHLKDSKVFMYSTTAEKEVVRQSKELGADDFIIKPTKTSELKETLTKIFEIRPQ
jgi:CheY-like chemotaxis protein